MAGTRTAPTINGTPTLKELSVRLIDASGDLTTVMHRFPATVTNAEIETYVAALQAVTQASAYEVRVADVYTSVEDSGNATNDERSSVFDRLGVLVRDASKNADNIGIPAPITGVMLGDADEVDPASVPLGTYFTAGLALLNGGAGGSGTYGVISTRYSERREINKATKI